MFTALMEKLKAMQPEHIPFDPATLDDPIALETEWGPAKTGGTNFRTHHLVQVDPDRIEFRAAWGAKLFGLSFFLIGLGVIIIFAVNGMDEAGFAITGELLMVTLFCSLFMAAGVGMFFYFTTPIVFDRRTGAFWKGRTAPDQTFNRLTLKNYAELKDIHALQLLAERIQGDKKSYLSYELNVVLTDGKRFNVVDHGDKARISQDARSLAEFLGVPLWNAVDFEEIS